ncbi:hypothetical protein B1J94_11810 [Leptospira kirschneri serovar Grippotyphosa]|nr:hypothetical protein B1J94_11810 [Leptospira kirschneri serovar Grippotyphosa]
MFPLCNLLTRAESPAGCLWQAGFAPVFLCRTHVIHNYIIKYLIFCMESVFCDKIYGTQFYRDQ